MNKDIVYRVWDTLADGRKKVRELTSAEMYEVINNSADIVGLGIDGSSSNTGLGFITNKGTLLGTGRVAKKSKEDQTEYRHKLKDELTSLLLACKSKLTNVWYEEPFIGFASATPVLMAIKPIVKDILYENKELSSIVYKEVNNKRWKKIFLNAHNCKLPIGTTAEKKAIASVLSPIFVYDNKERFECCVTQDEMDATGIVFAGWYSVKHNLEIESKKAIKPFKYEIIFELYDESVEDTTSSLMFSLSDVADIAEIPRKVLDNGIVMVTLDGRKSFDKLVYEHMNDEDKLLVFIYKASKYADKLFTEDAGKIVDSINGSGEKQTIVAYIWRKNRK